jgi:hypothetical protein
VRSGAAIGKGSPPSRAQAPERFELRSSCPWNIASKPGRSGSGLPVVLALTGLGARIRAFRLSKTEGWAWDGPPSPVALKRFRRGADRAACRADPSSFRGSGLGWHAGCPNAAKPEHLTVNPPFLCFYGRVGKGRVTTLAQHRLNARLTTTVLFKSGKEVVSR